MGFSTAPTTLVEPVQILDPPPRLEAGNTAGALPLEIAFLSGPIAPDLLHLAARLADEVGTTAEAVLLSEGLLTSERYYRALAAALALPFVERPLRPAATAVTEEVLQSGVAPLGPNQGGWLYLAAPRGEQLRRFVQLMSRADRSKSAKVAVTSPERLEALLRHDRRREVVKAATHGLPNWNAALSARAGLSPVQALAVLLASLVFCALAWGAPSVGLIVTDVVFATGFLMAVVLRLLATAASPRPRIARDPLRTRAKDLPVYTIIVPLFREAAVVRRLVAALDRLDYPHAKLDVIFVVEANDGRTLEAIDALDLPARYRTIIAPAGHPRTKPRALNIALQFARGPFVVVYDAEDEPEPEQLRAAVRVFAARPELACLQARLAIDNLEDSWLSALFAIEYAALFHVVNPGLAALGLPIALGGTSNHFRAEALRRVNGWDAWNVTEDIDLGIRFARFGLRVGSLESDTYEEAPHTLHAWLKQRCRWMKGWMITLGTHSRAPVRLWRDLGAVSTLAVVAMLFGTVASCLLGPFCIALLLLRAVTGNLFWGHAGMAVWWNGASLGLLLLGVASALWPALVGLRRRGLLRLTGWLALYPCYLLLLSIAAWQAAFEAFGRPHAWTKTEHGKAKRRLGSVLGG